MGKLNQTSENPRLRHTTEIFYAGSVKPGRRGGSACRLGAAVALYARSSRRAIQLVGESGDIYGTTQDRGTYGYDRFGKSRLKFVGQLPPWREDQGGLAETGSYVGPGGVEYFKMEQVI